MSKKFLVLFSFFMLISPASISYGADTAKPTPTKSTWALPPTSSGLTSITMKATHAVDIPVPPDTNSPPVQYMFNCYNDGTKSSAWQTSEEYTATGLTRGKLYWFRVRTEDSAATPNVGTYSVLQSEIAGTVRLDFDNTGSNYLETEAGYSKFRLADTGTETNNIIIDLSGNLNSKRMSQPYYDPPDSNHEQIYRDFIFGITPTSGITITLWGLGADRDCNITIFAFDHGSSPNRVADWNSNGTYLFTTDFNGGTSKNWPFSTRHPGDYAWTEANKADYLGRIVLKSWPDPCTAANQPFAFVNALVVSPKGSFVETKYAHRPQPFDGDMSVNTVLKWRNGGGVVTHDLYLGDDATNVADATRASHPGVQIYADLAADANAGYDPCFLELDKTYYWRVDENDTSNNPWKGEVWSFKTLPYFVVEDFNSYENDSALRGVWKDGSANGTSAEVSVETTIVRDGNSMRYVYANSNYPYYAEVNATAADLAIDPNGAKSLSLWFYGQAGNDANEQMYMKLTDSGMRTAKVFYDGNRNDLRRQWWQEWNIALQDFVDDNPSFDLRNVAQITIGFGDGTNPAPAAGTGAVYFEDIRLYKRNRICRTGWVVADDLNGDCVVDYRDLKIITDYWLNTECDLYGNCEGADFEPTDGVVNFLDLSTFAEQWLWYNNPPPCDEGFTIPPMPPYSSLPTNSYLPNPFRFMDGSLMTTKDQWTCRRAEIAALAQEFEYGYKQDTPYSATTGSWDGNNLIVTVNDNGKIISFSCSITYPSTGSAPYPAMIGCGYSFLNNTELSNMGVAVITFPSDQIAQEDSASSRGIGLFYDMYGSSHSAGALMAWAWGMDRLIDAIEKTPDVNIDPTRLGVTGCSRWGKGALACGAFDERIKLTIPQESGSGGAASWRVSDWQMAQGTIVQTLGEITGENCWFRANFNQFNSTATKLPFDHHEIEALCAPRALLVIENTSMVWLGNVSTWTTGNVAHMVWEALGIPDKMGYSSDGTHGHCAFPAAQQPEVTAYVQKFLVGGGTGNTNVMKTDGGLTFDQARWVDWTVPNLQ